jgi:hypothetical protein
MALGRAVLILAAAYLLTAAGLKAHALFYKPFAPGSPYLSRTGEVALVYGEVLLALGLFSGWQRERAWLAALATFLTFTVASLTLAVQGYSSCGCFGELHVNPWLTFVADGLLTGALLVLRPAEGLVGALRRTVPVGLAVAIVAGVVAAGLWALDVSAADLLARLRGDRLTVEPAMIHVGQAPPGGARDVTVRVRNWTDRAVGLQGGRTDAACVTTGELPVTIPARGEISLRVRFQFHGSPGRFRHSFWLFTNDPEQPQVVAWFVGRVG